MQPDHDIVCRKPAAAQESDQTGHSLARVHRVEDQCLETGRKADRFERRRIRDSICRAGVTGRDFDARIIPPIATLELVGRRSPDPLHIRRHARGLRIDIDADAAHVVAERREHRDDARLRASTA